MTWNVLGLAMLAFGFGFVAVERHAITTPVLIFAGACIALGAYLCDSAGFKGWLADMAAFVPWRKGS